MANLNDLAAWCDTVVPRAQAAINERKKEAVLALEQNLTQATPVDTGQAISNWQVTVETPATAVIDPYVPSVKGKHKNGDDGGAANAEAAMQAARESIADVQHGQSVFIANNVPYMEQLDVVGTSPQAEPGFVDRAIVAAVGTMDRATLDP